MLDDDNRPYWRMHTPGDVVSRKSQGLEDWMLRSGVVAVYNEFDRTLISFDARTAELELLHTLLSDQVIGPPPYFIKFRLNGTCLWLSDTLQDLTRNLLKINEMASLSFLPRGLTVSEYSEKEAQNVDFFRHVVQDPLSVSDEAIIFQEQNGILTYEEVGARAPVTEMLGQKWRADVIGTPYDLGFDDREFDKQTSVAYDYVWMSGRPHISNVRGAIDAPGGPIYQNYTRIIAPLPGRRDRLVTVSRLAGMAAPVYPEDIAQVCA